MTKPEIRALAYELLKEARATRFPFPIEGRIPNFRGAERAAERLAELEAWRLARRIKANPDSPQLPARRRALLEGKTLVMAVPRLAEDPCFFELDPARIAPENLKRAATIPGSAEFGRPADPFTLAPVDLILAGSVAVRTDGARLGKGGGYADLEFAIGRELGFVREDTPVVTTVHDSQITRRSWPIEPHDVHLAAIVTPERTVHASERRAQPAGVDFDRLDPAMRSAIPVLDRLETRRR